MPRVLAIAAHPDDIEFVMAGTMLQLAAEGWELHYFNLSSGQLGSMQTGPEETARIRRAEARRAAEVIGAAWHPPVAQDLEIFYEPGLLRQVASVVRSVAPSVVLTHSPEDYMEDHMNTSRLAVTAAFARGMPNFRTVPELGPVEGSVAVYHASPHGLQDQLRRPVHPHLLVDTTAVHPRKREALACHTSQKAWLDATQGMDSYLVAMDDFASILGALSGRFQLAEGWRRHSHLGFAAEAFDPLLDALGDRCLPLQP